LWNHAREVDAAYVRTQDRARDAVVPEAERFLFYRGLGRATLPVRFTAARGGTLSSEAGKPHAGSHVFVLRVEGGKGAYACLPSPPAGAAASTVTPGMTDAQPLPEFTRRLCDDLAARLVESGLYPKEARAMVNTWRTSYFQTEGTRALFVLPRSWT